MRKVPEPGASTAVESEPLHLLLVEDEPTQRLFLVRKLVQAGYLVDTAGNGREALDKLSTGIYSLLLTDWEMPVMDGVELCRAVRAARLPSYVYTVLLTGRSRLEHVVEGLSAGADDYLVKPVNDIELKARLATGRRIIRLEQSLRIANEENRRLSVTDPLTGTANRRHLMDELPRELARAARHRRPLSVILFDLDHFKRINDVHGHQAGDEVLRAAVHGVRKALRRTDWIARYGGEEFVVVLPDTPVSAAQQVAESLGSRLASTPVVAGDATLAVTASFGVAGWEQAVPADAATDRLISRGDECLYASKAAGRNRTTGAALD